MANSEAVEAGWEREGIDTLEVDRWEGWRKRGRTDARGWASVIVDWAVEPQGWRRARAKRARAGEKLYETVVTMQHEPGIHKARTLMILLYCFVFCVPSL